MTDLLAAAFLFGFGIALFAVGAVVGAAAVFTPIWCFWRAYLALRQMKDRNND